MAFDSNDNKQSKMIQLTGLWKSQTGQSLQGSLGGARLVIIPNKNKKTDKHPDYIALVAPYEPKDEGAKKQDDDLPF